MQNLLRDLSATAGFFDVASFGRQPHCKNQNPEKNRRDGRQNHSPCSHLVFEFLNLAVLSGFQLVQRFLLGLVDLFLFVFQLLGLTLLSSKQLLQFLYLVHLGVVADSFHFFVELFLQLFDFLICFLFGLVPFFLSL